MADKIKVSGGSGNLSTLSFTTIDDTPTFSHLDNVPRAWKQIIIDGFPFFFP